MELDLSRVASTKNDFPDRHSMLLGWLTLYLQHFHKTVLVNLDPQGQGAHYLFGQALVVLSIGFAGLFVHSQWSVFCVWVFGCPHCNPDFFGEDGKLRLPTNPIVLS